MAGVAGYVKDNNATIPTTGSANAYLATSSNTIAALATGLRFRFKASFTNTGACTLNLTPQGGAAFGAKAIKILRNGSELDPASGDILQNGIYDFNYDTAANSAVGAWILLNPVRNLKAKVISASRDVSATSGNVAYTGVGFKPIAIAALAGLDASVGACSAGFSDSAGGSMVLGLLQTSLVNNVNASQLIRILDSSTLNGQVATVASYDTDGFTLSWTKIGASGSSNTTLCFLCFAN